MKLPAILLSSCLIMTGCSSLNLKDNLSDVGATGATLGCAVLTGGNVPLCATVGVGTGVTINTVTGEPEGVDLAQVTNVHQEEVAKAQVKADTVESLGEYGIVGAIAAFIFYTIFTWWIGARRKRPEEYAAEAKAYEMERLVEELKKLNRKEE